MTATKYTTFTITREAYDAMGDRERARVMARLVKRMETDVREHVSGLVGEDGATLETVGAAFQTAYGKESTHAAAREWVDYESKRYTFALRTVIGEAYAAGMLSRQKGRTGTVSQREIGRAFGCSQSNVSQHLARIVRDNAVKAARADLKSLARESGLIVKGQDNDDVLKAIDSVAKSADGDAYANAVESLKAGTVPTVAPKTVTVDDILKAAEALMRVVDRGALVKSDDDVKSVQRIVAICATVSNYVK